MRHYTGYALSLHQPFATLLAYGLKVYETRGFFVPHYNRPRPFVIHAARAWGPEQKTVCLLPEVSKALEQIKPQLDEQLVALHALEVKRGGDLLIRRARVITRNDKVVFLPLGAFIATATVADCHQLGPDCMLDVAKLSTLERTLGNFDDWRWAWQITQRRPVRYSPAVGRQKWWQVSLPLEEVKQ